MKFFKCPLWSASCLGELHLYCIVKVTCASRAVATPGIGCITHSTKEVQKIKYPLDYPEWWWGGGTRKIQKHG